MRDVDAPFSQYKTREPKCFEYMMTACSRFNSPAIFVIENPALQKAQTVHLSS